MASSSPRPARRIATRLTPDLDQSGSSMNSSYRDRSANFEEDDENEVLSSSQDETDGTPLRRSPRREIRRSPALTPSPRNQSPRGGKKVAKLYPTLPSPDSTSASPKLYPSFETPPDKNVKSRKPLHSRGPRVADDTLSDHSAFFSPSSNFGSPVTARPRLSPGQRLRSPLSRKTPKPPPDEQNFTVHTCVICLVVFIVVCFIFVRPLLKGKEEPTEYAADDEMQIREAILDSFKKRIKELQVQFPNQSDRFWKVLKAATKRVMREPHPPQPAILLVAGDNSSRTTTECLTKKLSEIISAAYGAAREAVIIRHDSPASGTGAMTPEALKLSIDTQLSQSFSRDTRAAIVHDIGQLPGEAVMMFHAYCDHENAPYKDAVLILTVDVGDAVISKSDDSFVENILSKQLGRDLDSDKLSALLSRIANNIAIIEKETPEVLAKAC